MKLSFPCLLLGLFACGATEEQLRTRAAFDLQCPQAELQLTQLDARTQGVRGCDKQATYVESCVQGGADCTWVLNSDSKHK